MVTVNGCCCMSLRTAGLFIGWLWIALVVLSITDTINHLANDNPDDESMDENTTRHRSQNENIIGLVFLVMDVLFTGFLITGILDNKHKLFLPWLIYRAIGLIISIPILFVLAVFALLVTHPDTVLVIVIFVLFVLGLLCWSWVVIYSLYKEIRTNSMKPVMVPAFTESGPIGSPPPYQYVNKQLY